MLIFLIFISIRLLGFVFLVQSCIGYSIGAWLFGNEKKVSGFKSALIGFILIFIYWFVFKCDF